MMLNIMPEVGADSCCEDVPGWGSFELPTIEAHSVRSLLYFHLHSFLFLLVLFGQQLFDGLKTTPSQTRRKSIYLK